MNQLLSLNLEIGVTNVESEKRTIWKMYMITVMMRPDTKFLKFKCMKASKIYFFQNMFGSTSKEVNKDSIAQSILNSLGNFLGLL